MVNQGSARQVKVRHYVSGQGFEAQVNSVVLPGGLLPSDLEISDGKVIAWVREPSNGRAESSLWRLWPDVLRLAGLTAGAEMAWGLTDGHAVLGGDENYVAVDIELEVVQRGRHAARDPVLMGAMQGKLLFSARALGAGRELWRFHLSGMHLVTDIMPGPASADPRHASVIDGRLVFSAMDPEAGRETWSSDGTAEGTWRLFDLAPGPTDGMPPILSGESYIADGEYVYFPGRDPEAGVELHRFARSMITAPPAAPPIQPLQELAVSDCSCNLAGRGSSGVGLWLMLLSLAMARPREIGRRLSSVPAGRSYGL